ncbi:hypothetical protein, partial [Streptococcus pneumoniae]|uniref:hypothetical protein n=2 Tax=Bacteria TaxID=2 RepID=UPI0013DBBD4D
SQQTTTRISSDVDGLADLQIPTDALEANVLMSAKKIQLDQQLAETLVGQPLDRARRETQATAEREAMSSLPQENFSSEAVRHA